MYRGRVPEQGEDEGQVGECSDTVTLGRDTRDDEMSVGSLKNGREIQIICSGQEVRKE